MKTYEEFKKEYMEKLDVRDWAYAYCGWDTEQDGDPDFDDEFWDIYRETYSSEDDSDGIDWDKIEKEALEYFISTIEENIFEEWNEL